MTSKTVSLILLAGLCSAFTLAQGTKVGIVDADVVIQKSVKGKQFFERYNTFVDSKQEELKSLVDSYRVTEKDYQAKAASLSEDKAKEMTVELQRLQTDIKRKREDAERESKVMLNDGLEQFRKELAPLIRQVAQEQGLDMVINYGPQSSLVFFSDNINITDAVIAKYDAQAK